MSTVFAAPGEFLSPTSIGVYSVTDLILVFFICLRETIECSIIVAVLLAFLKQTLPTDGGDASINKRLVRQVRLSVPTLLTIANHCVRSGTVSLPA